MTRQELEAQVILAGENLGKSDAPYDQSLIAAFFEAWHSLAIYYRDNDDKDIGVLAMGAYLN